MASKRLEPKFFVVGVHDVITPFKFGDDRFRSFWLAEGQSLPFPIYFEDRPYNTHNRESPVGYRLLKVILCSRPLSYSHTYNTYLFSH